MDCHAVWYFEKFNYMVISAVSRLSRLRAFSFCSPDSREETQKSSGEAASESARECKPTRSLICISSIDSEEQKKAARSLTFTWSPLRPNNNPGSWLIQTFNSAKKNVMLGCFVKLV